MATASSQDALEVQKVSCLNTALTGYRALIYGISTDSGYDQCMNCFKQVWQALKDNNSLASNLVSGTQSEIVTRKKYTVNVQ